MMTSSDARLLVGRQRLAGGADQLVGLDENVVVIGLRSGKEETATKAAQNRKPTSMVLR